MHTTTITAADITSATPVGGTPRRSLRVAALSAGCGLLTLGLVACGGSSGAGSATTTATTGAAAVASSAATAGGAVVTVGDSAVTVDLAMSDGTKVGTATIAPGGGISIDSKGGDDIPDAPGGTDVVTRVVDAKGTQLGTITVRPDGTVISYTGAAPVTGGAPLSMPSLSMPSMTMPSMTMPSMTMDMSGMPTPPSRPGDQVNDSVNTGGSPTTIVSESCSPDGSQCSRQEIVQN